jgi:hypothetical protein
VIPLVPGTKVPVAWSYGVRDTADPDQVRAW